MELGAEGHLELQAEKGQTGGLEGRRHYDVFVDVSRWMVYTDTFRRFTSITSPGCLPNTFTNRFSKQGKRAD